MLDRAKYRGDSMIFISFRELILSRLSCTIIVVCRGNGLRPDARRAVNDYCDRGQTNLGQGFTDPAAGVFLVAMRR
jgi:hypothetical protein